MHPLLYPAREYICQVARFDPSKGIPDVIESYRKLRARLARELPHANPPQLLMYSPPLPSSTHALTPRSCGHGAIDDPDASSIYDATMAQLDHPRYDAIRTDVIVLRIGPSDQTLNALLSCARFVLQLSSREGFEVKVSEAIHKGKPIIATRAGGIPLQVRDGETGFLVDVGDTDAVAQHLWDLLTDRELYARMSARAATSVSDEVGTVGNAACWMFLAAKLARGEVLKPNARWVTDLYREEAGQPYAEGEPKLPRAGLKVMG